MLLVEALNILLNGIWSLLEVGQLGLKFPIFDSLAVIKGKILVKCFSDTGLEKTISSNMFS